MAQRFHFHLRTPEEQLIYRIHQLLDSQLHLLLTPNRVLSSGRPRETKYRLIQDLFGDQEPISKYSPRYQMLQNELNRRYPIHEVQDLWNDTISLTQEPKLVSWDLGQVKKFFHVNRDVRQLDPIKTLQLVCHQEDDIRHQFLLDVSQIIRNEGLTRWKFRQVGETQTKDFYLTDHALEDMTRWIYGVINEYDSGGSIFGDLRREEAIRLEIYTELPYLLGEDVSVNSHHHGAFFGYLHLLGVDLSRYQIYNVISDVIKPENRVNCLFYALKLSGLFTDMGLTEIRNTYFTNSIADVRVLGNISLTFKVNFAVNQYRKDQVNTKIYYYVDGKQTQKKPNGPICELGLFGDHWVLNELTGITKFSLDHFDQIRNLNLNLDLNMGRLIKGKFYKDDRIQGLTSFQLIHYLLIHKDQFLLEIPREILASTQYFNESSEVKLSDLYEIEELGHEEHLKVCEGFKTKKLLNQETYLVGYYDYETDVSSFSIHTPICVAFKSGGYSRIYMGQEASKNLIDLIWDIMRQEDKKIMFMVAHNAKYDISFLLGEYAKDPYVSCSRVFNDNQMYQYTFVKMIYGQKLVVNYIDSYKFLSQPLADIAKSFLKDQEKEVFPYQLLNLENLQKGLTREQLSSYAPWKLKPHLLRQFYENCDSHGFWTLDGLVNLKSYTQFYNLRDVEILEQAFNAFRVIIQTRFQIDPINFVSISSLAQYLLVINHCYDDVKLLTTNNREFIQKSITGGRTMIANNQRGLHVFGHMKALDARSLYPSAMKRLETQLGGILLGHPKVIHTFETNAQGGYVINGDSKVDGFFVEVEIMEVHRHLRFPLIHIKNSEGIIVWGDQNVVGRHLTISMIEYEDLIKFQGCVLKVLGGLYYNQGRSPVHGNFISQIYQERMNARKEKNDVLANCLKLLLNSSYGKLIERIYRTNKILCNGEIEWHKQTINHADYLISGTPKINGTDLYELEFYNETAQLEGRAPHIGSEILAMSKRIMNEIMVLSETLEIPIYYQDTDSCHMETKDVDVLITEYERIYGRELLGVNLGQFAIDNDDQTEYQDEKLRITDKSTMFVDEAIYISPKVYWENLIGINSYQETARCDYFRCKSVPRECFMYYQLVQQVLIKDQYLQMKEGKEIRYDLTCGNTKACFEWDGMQISNKSMIRTIKL